MEYGIGCEMTLLKDGRPVVGPQEYHLLAKIEELEQLSLLAKRLGMLEGDVLSLADSLNRNAGEPIITVQGGSLTLTPPGREALGTYRLKQHMLEEQMRNLWQKPWITTDGIALLDGRLVLIRRGKAPFEGMYALPGGIVAYGERVEDCVVREMEEETGLRTKVIGLVGVYSDKDRDPRGHFITIAFNLEVVGGSLCSGDDAKEVDLFEVDDLPDLAADHRRIIDDAMRMRDRPK